VRVMARVGVRVRVRQHGLDLMRARARARARVRVRVRVRARVRVRVEGEGEGGGGGEGEGEGQGQGQGEGAASTSGAHSANETWPSVLSTSVSCSPNLCRQAWIPLCRCWQRKASARLRGCQAGRTSGRPAARPYARGLTRAEPAGRSRSPRFRQAKCMASSTVSSSSCRSWFDAIGANV
jgi:hypothetical protein